MKNDCKLYIKKMEAGFVARETWTWCSHVDWGGRDRETGWLVGWACGVEGNEGSIGILNFLCP